MTTVRPLVVGCSRCAARQEVPRWPLPGLTCPCGGLLSLKAGSTQVLEKTLVARAKAAGQVARDPLAGTLEDAAVLALPTPQQGKAEDDPLEGTVDDAGVLPIPTVALVEPPTPSLPPTRPPTPSLPLTRPPTPSLPLTRPPTPSLPLTRTSSPGLPRTPTPAALVRPQAASPLPGLPRTPTPVAPLVRPVARTLEDARVLALPGSLDEQALAAPIGAALPSGGLGHTREDARVLPIPDASALLDAPAEAVAAPDPEPGPALVVAPAMRVAGYELLEEIGRGSYGVVYRARDPRHERLVALKVLDRLDPRSRARFQRELLATARLRHPHVVGLLDSGKDESGRPYLVLELVEGPSLARAWSGPCVAAAEVAARVRVARDLARALAFVHAQGVLHRDVKPENVLLEGDGRARLIDLGLAQVGESEGLTVDGEPFGTPAYMSPEQAGSGAVVDGRSDVYSLGATLYRGLAGHPPFEAGGVELFLAIFRTEPAPPSGSAPVVPPELDAIVLRCLEKDPAHRYASAEQLADDLDRWLRGAAVEARAVKPRARALRRHLPALAAGLLGVAVGVGASHLLLSARSRHAELSSAASPQREPEPPVAEPPAAQREPARAPRETEGLVETAGLQSSPLVAREKFAAGEEDPGPASPAPAVAPIAPPPATVPAPAPTAAPASVPAGFTLADGALTGLLGLGLGAFALLAARAGGRRQQRLQAVEALARWQAARAQAEPLELS